MTEITPEFQSMIEGLVSPEVRRFVKAAPGGHEIFVWAASERRGEIFGRVLNGSPLVPRGKIYAMDPANHPSQMRGLGVA